MEYVYPAIFSPNSDDSYTITYPDLPGCISEGKTLPGAMQWAQWALTDWLEYLTVKDMSIPPASHINDIKVEDSDEIVTLIYTKLGEKVAV